MQKNVLLVHGWPKPIKKSDTIYRYFIDRGYKVFCPYLFGTKDKFSVKQAEKILKECLGGVISQVIVGVSLGGLIAPNLAKDYPDSKLVFISSGIYFSPDNWLAKYGSRLCGRGIIKWARKVDREWLLRLYRLINLNRGEDGKVDQSDVEMAENLKKIFALSEDRIIEIMKAVFKIDNTDLLSKLNNKSIIFSGDEDVIMPPWQGEEMNGLLKNSSLEIISGQHFNLVCQKMLERLDEFLS